VTPSTDFERLVKIVEGRSSLDLVAVIYDTICQQPDNADDWEIARDDIVGETRRSPTNAQAAKTETLYLSDYRVDGGKPRGNAGSGARNARLS